MDEAAYNSFVTALGESYCDVLGPHCEYELVPQDGYEAFVRAFGAEEVTPASVHAAQVSEEQLTRLRDAARALTESDQINIDHMREVVRRTLWRWPPDAT